jgi:hypothetical protein
LRCLASGQRRLARAVGCLPRKPRDDRDWADNVFRARAMAYDLGLWIGALDAVAEMGEESGDPGRAGAPAGQVRRQRPRWTASSRITSAWTA